MWRSVLRVLGAIVGWSLVSVYIYYASTLAQDHRSQQRVERVVVRMLDGSEGEKFATPEQIRSYLERSSFKMENSAIDSVDAVKIADYVARNGYVRDVDVYVTYSGELYIDVKQHNPAVRLLCGGLNSYVTSEGDVFRSPRGGAYYAAVITGGYRPMFNASYEGVAEMRCAALKADEDDRLDALGERFSALKKERGDCLSRRSELRKKRKKSFFESKDSYEIRKAAINADIAKCDAELERFAQRKAALERERQAIEECKKKLQKKYDDFANLINFVTEVSEDSFWGAEIVQFVADTTSMGEISLRLVPRSGDFIIEFGTLEKREEKLAKLQNFYDDGLSRVGWNRYKVVDVRYNKQVICTE